MVADDSRYFLLYITMSIINYHIMNMKLASLTLLSTLAITSCQTTNPYTGAPQTSRSTSGALIGGIVGAGLGSLTGSGSTDRRQKAMIGAGIGALTGGVIGNYMDKQESELRRQLQGSGVSVTRSGHDLILNMPGDITFATDSSRLNGQFINTLNSVGIVLAKYNKTMVNITGHTDNVGARSYNFQLSERRAQSVAQYLRSRGVVSQRMLISGSGPDQPIASNSTASGRQKNRRVSIRLVPNRQ